MCRMAAVCAQSAPVVVVVVMVVVVVVVDDVGLQRGAEVRAGARARAGVDSRSVGFLFAPSQSSSIGPTG